MPMIIQIVAYLSVSIISIITQIAHHLPRWLTVHVLPHIDQWKVWSYVMWRVILEYEIEVWQKTKLKYSSEKMDQDREIACEFRPTGNRKVN